MTEAVSASEVVKLFGKERKPRWKRHSSNGNGASEHPKMAVDRVSFSVGTGEIFGILGPNGSGKSTLIRLIASLLLPDAGQISVFGYDVVRQPYQVKNLVNRVSVEASFFKKLSPMENLTYGARLYGLGGREIHTKVIEILTRLGLEERSIFNPMEQMSRGMQQKVAIARALLGKPRLLLLDEPTTGLVLPGINLAMFYCPSRQYFKQLGGGRYDHRTMGGYLRPIALDPSSKREVQGIVRELRDLQNTTILLTTHDMVEAESLCDRIAIIHNGRIVALDTPPNLKALGHRNGSPEPTFEDVFLELTGKRFQEEDEEE